LIGFAYWRTNRVFERLGSHDVPAFFQAWIRSITAVLIAAILGVGVVLSLLD
jgi:lipopolysaccharide export LptBFGC system permease protein LptF